MCKLLMLIMILPIMAIFACSESPTESLESQIEPTIEELEAKVVENCYILQAAIEEYKTASESRYPDAPGIYPPSVSTDPYELGITLLDFLPNGDLLENPFTGERTEPSTDTIATEPGQIGYGVGNGGGAHQAYAITGCGEDSLVALLNNIRDVENRVIYDCFLVRNTLQHYIETHNGCYPDMPELVATLPEGIRLRNHLTLARTEPQFLPASIPGDIGINYTVLRDFHIGYFIDGCGVVVATPIFQWTTFLGTTEVMIQYSDEVYPLLWIISRFKQYE